MAAGLGDAFAQMAARVAKSRFLSDRRVRMHLIFVLGYLLANFLDPTINTRGDEYGGSLENRVRLVRELIEETKEAVYAARSVVQYVAAWPYRRQTGNA